MERTWRCSVRHGAFEQIETTQCQPGEAAVWFLGQLGFAVKTCEATFYIDAVLTDLSGRRRRFQTLVSRSI